MDFHLVVLTDFADFERGQSITDPETVAAVLAGGNAGHVVKIAARDLPAPLPAQEA